MSNKYYNQLPNYDKHPVVRVPGMENRCVQGWDSIVATLKARLELSGKSVKTVVVECYQGVMDEEIKAALKAGFPEAVWFDSADAMYPAARIDSILRQDITDDEIFGYMTRLNMDCYFDPER